MSFSELIFLLVLGGGVWLWLDSLRARESCIRAVRRACDDEGLQLLDETVACRRQRFARDGNGVLRWQRLYGFEFSDRGDDRREGSIQLLGDEVEFLQLRPKLYVVPRLAVPDDGDETLH